MEKKKGRYLSYFFRSPYLGPRTVYKHFFSSQKEAQDICDNLTKSLGIRKKVKVVLNKAHHPLYFGELLKNYIILYKGGDTVGILIHELTHVKTDSHLHNSKFKRVQEEIYSTYKEVNEKNRRN